MPHVHAPAEAAAHDRRGRRRIPARLTLPVCAGAVVFGVNNILLARLLTSLPGGTALAATTLAGVAFVALRLRRAGSVTLLYATYAALGILGHLGVDAGAYVTHLPRLLAAAAAFDAVMVLCGFKAWALPLGLLPCAGILLFGSGMRAAEWLVALLLGCAGLAIGLGLHEGLRRLRERPGAAFAVRPIREE